MNDKKVYFDEDGNQWNRIYVNGQITTNPVGKIDAFSQKDFISKTNNIKNSSLGEMWDLSSELSEKRKQVLGHDPLREQAEGKYFQKTGKRHPHSKKKDIKVNLVKGTID